MKLMTRQYVRLITAMVVLLTLLACPTMGQASNPQPDIYELSLDDNLVTPKIKNSKHAARVQEYQYDMAVGLKKQNYDVEIMRDDEVIVITIPASQLFAPNDTALTQLGQTLLKPLMRLLKNPGFYKMLLVMHSDNTGSTAYTLNLTRQRVNAVYDWIDANASVEYVVPYALGETDPIVDNNSVDNRKRNRRLEIYLVPEETMLQQAKKGKVNIALKNK